MPPMVSSVRCAPPGTRSGRIAATGAEGGGAAPVCSGRAREEVDASELELVETTPTGGCPLTGAVSSAPSCADGILSPAGGAKPLSASKPQASQPGRAERENI